MSKLKAALTRKFGVGKLKLPAWAWLAIVAGAVFAYRRFHKAPQTGQTTTDQSAPLSDTSSTGPLGGGTGTGGSQGGGSDSSGGASGDAGSPPQEPLAPVSGGGPSYAPGDPGYGYGSDGQGAPTPTQVTGATPRTAGTGSLTSTVLPSGAILRYNPATGVVTEQAPGKSPYRVASGVTDFAAYVTKVRRQATSRLAKVRKAVTPKRKPQTGQRPQPKADKGSAQNPRQRTTSPRSASPGRSSAPHTNPPRTQTTRYSSPQAVRRPAPTQRQPVRNSAPGRGLAGMGAHTYVQHQSTARRVVVVHRRPPIFHRR